MIKKQQQLDSHSSGFTLIEIMVSVSIFAIIMVFGISALITVTNAYKGSQQQKIALDSLSFTLETISRDIRTGTDYYSGQAGSLQTPQDGTDNSISFLASDNRGYFTYYVQDGVLYREINGGSAEPLTSSTDLVISDDSRFSVIGSGTYPSDTYQPSVWINLEGTLVNNDDRTFSLQTIVSQRKIDF